MREERRGRCGEPLVKVLSQESAWVARTGRGPGVPCREPIAYYRRVYEPLGSLSVMLWSSGTIHHAKPLPGFRLHASLQKVVLLPILLRGICWSFKGAIILFSEPTPPREAQELTRGQKLAARYLNFSYV